MWNGATMVGPAANVSGSTSVACWLLPLVKVSVPIWCSRMCAAALWVRVTENASTSTADKKTCVVMPLRNRREVRFIKIVLVRWIQTPAELWRPSWEDSGIQQSCGTWRDVRRRYIAHLHPVNV